MKLWKEEMAFESNIEMKRHSRHYVPDIGRKGREKDNFIHG